jgi:hypothetical protein
VEQEKAEISSWEGFPLPEGLGTPPPQEPAEGERFRAHVGQSHITMSFAMSQ